MLLPDVATAAVAAAVCFNMLGMTISTTTSLVVCRALLPCSAMPAAKEYSGKSTRPAVQQQYGMKGCYTRVAVVPVA